MERHQQQALLIALLQALEAQGSWSGETHVQKSVYFLQAGLGAPFTFDFILYRHGPFSFGLREALGELRGLRLIDVESRTPYGPTLLPSESGMHLVQRHAEFVEQHRPMIEFIAQRLGKRGVVDLERLGAALYVRQEDSGRPAELQASRIHELKPHLQPEIAIRAVEEVEQLLRDAAAPFADQSILTLAR